jgi:hypothetical protein
VIRGIEAPVVDHEAIASIFLVVVQNRVGLIRLRLVILRFCIVAFRSEIQRLLLDRFAFILRVVVLGDSDIPDSLGALLF